MQRFLRLLSDGKKGEIIRPKTFKKILEGAGLTVDDFIKIRMKL